MKLKRTLATIIAATTMAVSITSMSAEAYAPTATKTFSVGSETATATLYKDSTKAYATTALDYASCTVTLSYGNIVKVGNDYSHAEAKIDGNASPASSSHIAAKPGATGSTDLVYY